MWQFHTRTFSQPLASAHRSTMSVTIFKRLSMTGYHFSSRMGKIGSLSTSWRSFWLSTVPPLTACSFCHVVFRSLWNQIKIQYWKAILFWHFVILNMRVHSAVSQSYGRYRHPFSVRRAGFDSVTHGYVVDSWGLKTTSKAVEYLFFFALARCCFARYEFCDTPEKHTMSYCHCHILSQWYTSSESLAKVPKHMSNRANSPEVGFLIRYINTMFNPHNICGHWTAINRFCDRLVFRFWICSWLQCVTSI